MAYVRAPNKSASQRTHHNKPMLPEVIFGIYDCELMTVIAIIVIINNFIMMIYNVVVV